MKVRDLIALLKGENPDMDVQFAYEFGDHWRTEVAQNISSVEECAVRYSEYHSMYATVEDEDADFATLEDTDTPAVQPDAKRVVLLYGARGR